jgi:ketosteroid isomerase-like protein
MSEENVEAVRAFVEAVNRTFTEGTSDLFERVDPEVEWLPLAAIVEGTRYQGPDGVRQWIEDVKRDWTIWEVRTDELLDLGDGRVLALGSWHARGRRGGTALDIEQAAWLLEIRQGKVRRMETFTERRKALEAVGLRE